jgi:SAM-dependent methyltransferase
MTQTPETRPVQAAAPPVLSKCPACEGDTARVIYRLDQVPVHSCMLLPTAQAALNYPTRPLELAFCPECGFIFNRRFDSSIQEYGADYDGSQEFSQTFSRFSQSLVRRLAGRFDLRGRTVLEIGCGKGEFLAALCRAAGCHGIGIDPAYTADRELGLESLSIEMIADFFRPEHLHRDVDFICCRHTLEHISDVGRFISALRQGLGDQHETPVFFEVPDATRVLEEGAFWDIYYEHCSYFTPRSHAALFERYGFDVAEWSVEYDGQYLLQTAYPAACPSTGRTDAAPPSMDHDHLVTRFEQAVTAQQAHWRDVLAERAAAGQRVVLWGGGSKAVAFLTTLRVEHEVAFAVDINPHKQGKFTPGTGHAVRAPSALKDWPPSTVIVMNPVYREEVAADLDEMGLQPELLTV